MARHIHVPIAIHSYPNAVCTCDMYCKYHILELPIQDMNTKVWNQQMKISLTGEDTGRNEVGIYLLNFTTHREGIF